MKQSLLISFNHRRIYEDSKSYSIACLLAYLKRSEDYQRKYNVLDVNLDMELFTDATRDVYVDDILRPYRLDELSSIAISVYIWNDYLINWLINILKSEGFKGNFILGGNNISCCSLNELKNRYPDANIFIQGFAEESLRKAILKEKQSRAIILNDKVNTQNLPSVYLNNELSVIQNQEMVRMETQRGCPYNCSFCAFPDAIHKGVHPIAMARIIQEMEYMKVKNVGKINIIDPVFNCGKYYNAILEAIRQIDLRACISLQTRFELIKGSEGERFLNNASQLNTKLEFGLQTTSIAEMNCIERRNDLNHIKKVIRQLNDRKIDYEISIIYGLPYQTVDSFNQTIEFAYNNGCTKIMAYPLMLLPGTALYYKKDELGLQVGYNENNIPIVISGNTFNTYDYLIMAQIAEKINFRKYN